MAAASNAVDHDEQSGKTTMKQGRRKMPPTAKRLKDEDYAYKGLTKLAGKYGPIFLLPVGSV